MSINTNIEQHLKQIEQGIIAIDNAFSLGASSPIDSIINAIKVIRQELTAQAERTKYEGWTNYETFRCYEWFVDTSRAKSTGMSLISNSDNVDLKGYFEANSPLNYTCGSGSHKDLLQSAIDRINFTEIAKRLIAEAKGVE